MQRMQKRLLFVATKNSSRGTGKSGLWNTFLCACNSIISQQNLPGFFLNYFFIHSVWSHFSSFVMFEECSTLQHINSSFEYFQATVKEGSVSKTSLEQSSEPRTKIVFCVINCTAQYSSKHLHLPAWLPMADFIQRQVKCNKPPFS